MCEREEFWANWEKILYEASLFAESQLHFVRAGELTVGKEDEYMESRSIHDRNILRRRAKIQLEYADSTQAEFVTLDGPLNNDAITAYFKGVCEAASGCLLKIAQREVGTIFGGFERGRDYVRLAKETVGTHRCPWSAKFYAKRDKSAKKSDTRDDLQPRVIYNVMLLFIEVDTFAVHQIRF